MLLSALVVSSPGPLANTAQILQDDTAPGALVGFHKSLADAVVGVVWRAVRSARQVSASALGALGAYRWQCGAALSEPLALVLPRFAAAYVPVAGGSDCDTIQMNAQPALRVVVMGHREMLPQKGEGAFLYPLGRVVPSAEFR